MQSVHETRAISVSVANEILLFDVLEPNEANAHIGNIMIVYVSNCVFCERPIHKRHTDHSTDGEKRILSGTLPLKLARIENIALNYSLGINFIVMHFAKKSFSVMVVNAPAAMKPNLNFLRLIM